MSKASYMACWVFLDHIFAQKDAEENIMDNAREAWRKAVTSVYCPSVWTFISRKHKNILNIVSARGAVEKTFEDGADILSASAATKCVRCVNRLFCEFTEPQAPPVEKKGIYWKGR